MPIQDHIPTKKQFVRIITCDPATRRIEGQLKDLAIIQIALWEIPSGFRWPKENEIWAVHNINGYWHLGSPVELESELPIEDLQPGDTKIGGGPGSSVYIDGSLKDSDGNTYVTTRDLTSGGETPDDGETPDTLELRRALAPPIVTELPTEPVDRDEVLYQVPALPYFTDTGETVRKFTDGANYTVTRVAAGAAGAPGAKDGLWIDQHAYNGANTDNSIMYTAFTFPAPGIYTLSTWVWVPANWTGAGDMGLYVWDYADYEWIDGNGIDLERRDQWQKLFLTVRVGADLVGSIGIYTEINPLSTGTGVLYTDLFEVAHGPAGEYWHLRYIDAMAGSHKWLKLSGPPLLITRKFSPWLTPTLRTAYTNYDALSGDLALTIPLAGDYRVRYDRHAYLKRQNVEYAWTDLFSVLAYNGTVDEYEGVYDVLETFTPTSPYSITNLTTDRTYNADGTSVAELADILGTLIGDLQGRAGDLRMGSREWRKDDIAAGTTVAPQHQAVTSGDATPNTTGTSVQVGDSSLMFDPIRVS